ncbi:endonuclease/exonuclease/phosphatase family protein [Niallia sp. Krafla_26]|uniref:endonuclease/exonuclease/phosphatase family protein n=1 Tax=Niallia sp. Krafla_26 TaxID=3064703 RepID=UPI003D182C6B
MSNLRLATYNIRMETPDDVEDLWVNRKNQVMKVIRDYDFDLVGLQEVKEGQLQDLQSLTDYDYFGVGRSEEESNEYNPIFYKKSKFDLVEFDTFWLSETLKYEEKEKRWEADCPRICTWGRFQIRESGKEFYVFNTHFDHRSEEARFQSTQILLDRIAAIVDHPVFLMGDFNGERDERFYQVLVPELRNVVDGSPHHTGPTGTCTGVGFNHGLSWDQYHWIDYIFVNQYVRVEKTTVITDRFHGRYPSDHFPVCVDVGL